jgi:DNA mismatch repair ATPase MutS
LAGLPTAVIDRADTLLKMLENQDVAPSTVATVSPTDVTPTPEAVPTDQQLDLFATAVDQATQTVLLKLQTADVANMTPIETMLFLHELQQELK